MGNPHALESELAYLAGIVDGEGTITLERSGIRRLNGVMGLSPKVLVSNTDTAIIQFSINVMERMGVVPHVKCQLGTYKGRRKTCYWLSVAGLAKTKKVLVPLLPFLVGKQAQARLLLDFIEYRGDPVLAKGKPYGDYELGLLEKVRALNFRGASETEDHGLRHQFEMAGK